ncbi:AI-2E family transporter [Gloeobacter kilaueensis]|uniref:Pheromone autoinducer 2 transporter n=1 Tax=Gloeobacter kilaueensis (strain ATCC BAA-2537 / CCAP 1431/1 / ULC 316 / JS1) TaxID=1183438 RepID=U5QIH1_GLOK1|nr:AI-2E family transporter [Gloeobacter kilaueensis]AGY57394.1 pheromone autoinducer 2 transporter [Gloeobacter kilaueensis JS1]
MPVLTPLQRSLITWLLLVAGSWAALQVLEYFREFITIFVIAGLIAFLLSYPVAFLSKYLPRSTAAFVVYSLAGLVVAIFAVVVAPLVSQQTVQLVRSLPDLVRSGSLQLEAFLNWARKLGLPVDTDQLVSEMGSRLQQQLQVLTSPQSLEFLLGTFTGVLNFVLILVIAFYMLLEGHKLWQELIGFLPGRIRERFSESLQYNLRGFFTGQLILGLFMSLCLTPFYLFVGVPFALLLALFVGVMELIPFIGATLGISVVVIICVTQNPLLALWVLIGSVVIQQIKDNVIAPRILGNFTGLSPVLIFGALLIGAKVSGLLGVLLAIPVSGVIKSLYESLVAHHSEPPPALPSLPEPTAGRGDRTDSP